MNSFSPSPLKSSDEVEPPDSEKKPPEEPPVQEPPQRPKKDAIPIGDPPEAYP